MIASFASSPETMKAAHDQYLVSHGKSGVVGVFTATEPMPLERGVAVIVQTVRGVEIGAVLGAASLKQARLIGASSAGVLLRRATPNDEAERDRLRPLEQQIFETSRAWAERDALPLEVLDVELLFDGKQAIVQFVGDGVNAEAFALALERHFQRTVRLENLAAPAPAEEKHGCDKPDCGKTADGGGGCTTCSTGGGCSSCGSSKIDVREYFGHLRTKMETTQRIPLA